MKNLSKTKNNKSRSRELKEVKGSVNRWNELIELSQLKEKEYADEWDTYYTNDYYDIIANYENEYINGGNY